MDLGTFSSEQCTASSSGNDWLISPSVFTTCWKHTEHLDYYNCVYEDPDEDDAMSAELAMILSRLRTKGSNVHGSETGSENLDKGDLERSNEEDLEPEAIKEQCGLVSFLFVQVRLEYRVNR
ncbi:hypothetical protein L915_04019 [Phytophthora nicotianae]|uniref:Uncharacterized protein n=1 Tax=Phytophthora nicotianae TaxID=4792 RepID=W2HDU6_PHYNI|nr:hypothetical protein L915_04019 [Phytophthora nicotianae]